MWPWRTLGSFESQTASECACVRSSTHVPQNAWFICGKGPKTAAGRFGAGLRRGPGMCYSHMEGFYGLSCGTQVLDCRRTPSIGMRFRYSWSLSGFSEVLGWRQCVILPGFWRRQICLRAGSSSSYFNADIRQGPFLL